MVLGHAEILRRAKEGLLENFEEKNVGGAGVDVRVANFYRMTSAAKLGIEERVLPEVEAIEGTHVTVKPQEYILVDTMERVNMPLDLAAWMYARSTLQRSGIYLFTSLIDPGYHGTLTFGLKNLGSENFKLERGARIAQIVFEEVQGESKAYEGRYQGGKVV